MLGCSGEEIARETPENFTIKYEILGTGEVPKMMYTTNEGRVEETGVQLPYVKEIQYITGIEGETDENGTTSYGCEDITFAAFADRSDGEIEEMNIFINGELKDSKNNGYYYVPGENWKHWEFLYFRYLRRGADRNTYNCN